ncbi:hypothetical protein niasHS_008103 [Heterodera schachtii]|uniref:DNA-directed RNA polymerase n=1 Tax=Heterodera schachtii TaxID=97005 RepID=A0ABD2JA42_HETSC
MTLKTFHFAGVASMNITQGVPRIKEIINAVRSISTPIITVALADERDEKLARRVKARVEKTTLGDISDYVEQVFLPDDLFVLIKLNTRRIRAMQLELTMDTIIDAICAAKLPVPRILYDQVRSVGKFMLLVRPVESSKCSMTMYMHYLKQHLPSGSTMPWGLNHFRNFDHKVVVKGLPGVQLCVINADEKRGDTYELFVEGTNFKEVLGLTEINGPRTKFNNALVIAEVLGIEAARGSIISEILTTMGEHGIELDRRHVQLLADLQTYRGQVLGITRDGLVKMKESVLVLASFERTIDHLYEAAFFGQQDRISGVSKCIIIGTPMGIGTGMFKLLQCGSKESFINIAQMIALVGQQSIAGKRPSDGFEDLAVNYDNTVRTSNNEVVQFTFGDDGLDPAAEQQQHQHQDSTDYGKDEDSAESLLKKHRALISDLEAFNTTIEELRPEASQCKYQEQLGGQLGKEYEKYELMIFGSSQGVGIGQNGCYIRDQRP